MEFHIMVKRFSVLLLLIYWRK